jgi:inosine-uridine nucleoside N-ribohydrolase
LKTVPEKLKSSGTVLFLFALLFCSCASPRTSPKLKDIPRVIFDTDIGSDCDDAGALAILNLLANKGEVQLLGVIFSSGKNRFGVGVCDAIDTYYGRGDLPLGQYQADDVGDPQNSYSREIASATNLFPHNIFDSAPPLIETYKKLLRQQPDDSVTIVMVGHPCGLLHLMLDSQGMKLIRKKVKRCVAMTHAGENPVNDWNFGHNGAAFCAGEFLQNWPKPIYFSDAGNEILTGNKLLPSTPANNPVREAYRRFQNSLVKGRPSWDPIAALFAARPEYFTVESNGELEQNEKRQTFWNREKQNPLHHRVRPKISNEELRDLIETLMSESP